MSDLDILIDSKTGDLTAAGIPRRGQGQFPQTTQSARRWRLGK